jgi:hypothetical protein
MFKKSSTLILLSISSKPLGGIRELLFIFAFGVSVDVDNYIYMGTILSILYCYINASIQIFITQYNYISNERSKYCLLTSFFYSNHFVISIIFIISLLLFILFFNTSYFLMFILISISFIFKSYNNVLSNVLIQNNKQETNMIINYLYQLSILFIIASTLYLGLILLCIGDVTISILITILLLQKTKGYLSYPYP